MKRRIVWDPAAQEYVHLSGFAVTPGNGVQHHGTPGGRVIPEYDADVIREMWCCNAGQKCIREPGHAGPHRGERMTSPIRTTFPIREGTHPGTVICQCGYATGVPCASAVDPANVVLVDRMPLYLRASHSAAGNSGEFPHNDAERLACTDDCADLLVEESPEWVSKVPRRPSPEEQDAAAIVETWDAIVALADMVEDVGTWDGRNAAGSGEENPNLVQLLVTDWDRIKAAVLKLAGRES